MKNGLPVAEVHCVVHGFFWNPQVELGVYAIQVEPAKRFCANALALVPPRVAASGAKEKLQVTCFINPQPFYVPTPFAFNRCLDQISSAEMREKQIAMNHRPKFRTIVHELHGLQAF